VFPRDKGVESRHMVRRRRVRKKLQAGQARVIVSLAGAGGITAWGLITQAAPSPFWERITDAKKVRLEGEPFGTLGPKIVKNQPLKNGDTKKKDTFLTW